MFNLFDLVFLFILAAGFWFGFKTGLIASAFYAVGGYCAIGAAHAYAAKAGVNFYAAFVVMAAGVMVVGYLLSKAARTLLLGIFDRIGGAALGTLLGALVVVFIVTHLPSKFSVQSRNLLLSSFTATRVVGPVQKIDQSALRAFNTAVVKPSGKIYSAVKKRIQ